MVFNFSENLIKETISCFYDEDGISLSIEQAQEYLTSFADLFLAFAGKIDHPASAEAGGQSPVCLEVVDEVLVTPRERFKLHHDRHY